MLTSPPAPGEGAAELKAEGDAVFRATGMTVAEPGFLAVYAESQDEDAHAEAALSSTDAADVLAALGPKGYVVNVGRGTVLDTQALLDALRDKRIAGAGLDVLEGEPALPPLLSALLEFDNVVITPHCAARAPESVPMAMNGCASAVRTSRSVAARSSDQPRSCTKTRCARSANPSSCGCDMKPPSAPLAL